MIKNFSYYISKELQYGANNYKSLPVCLKKGKGIYLTDINDKNYIDFLSCFSAVNQGHCHPKIIKKLKDQSMNLTLTSRAYYNDKLGRYMEYMCRTFKYDKLLPMNTGVEAGETAIKLARKWGYQKKNIKKNKAKVLFAKNNFWGRTIAACSSSSDEDCYSEFGPFTPGFELIPYNNIKALENRLKKNKNIVAYMLEPIQGEAGVIIPDKDYLKNVKNLCEKHNVLMIADEVQTGLGRTGELIASPVKPDILCLGKALSGGTLPISAVLADKEVMDCITPGTHGSTFGGSPLASAVAVESVQVLKLENMIYNSKKMGKIFRNSISSDYIKDIRGKGLMNAIELHDEYLANKLCHDLLENGLLTKVTHGTTLRMSPPLIIDNIQMEKSLEIINKCLINL